MAKVGQPSLSGGEVSAPVAARYDVNKRGASLGRARNTLGMAQGGQYSRAGLEFCDQVIDHNQTARLFSFVFAADMAYALEFQPNRMRVYYNGGLVMRPRLTITAITKAQTAVVTVPSHGYVVGYTLVFEGVEGMVEINGLRGQVLEVVDANRVRISIDTREFSAFTADTGGVAGDSKGGSGGYAPPPAAGEEPPPAEVPINPPTPPIPPRPPAGEYRDRFNEDPNVNIP